MLSLNGDVDLSVTGDRGSPDDVAPGKSFVSQTKDRRLNVPQCREW